MSTGLIDKALAWLGNRVSVLGDFYTAEWSASSSALNTVLIKSPTQLPAGTYIVTVNPPTMSAACLCHLRTTQTSYIIGSDIRYHIISSGNGFTDIVQLTDSDYLQVVSDQSASVTYSALTRGYMRAIRIE